MAARDMLTNMIARHALLATEPSSPPCYRPKLQLLIPAVQWGWGGAFVDISPVSALATNNKGRGIISRNAWGWVRGSRGWVAAVVGFSLATSEVPGRAEGYDGCQQVSGSLELGCGTSRRAVSRQRG